LPIGTTVDEVFLEYGVFHWAGLSPGSTPTFDLRRSSNSWTHTVMLSATLSSKQWKYCQHPIAGVSECAGIGDVW
jgi:hypothetical protein